MTTASLFGVCTPADLPLFFGPDEETARQRQVRTAKAKAVCRTCPARTACLNFAQDNRLQFGVWGGVDLEDRRRRMCGNGLHLMDTANTWVDSSGHRNCRACRNASDRRERARKQQEERKAA